MLNMYSSIRFVKTFLCPFEKYVNIPVAIWNQHIETKYNPCWMGFCCRVEKKYPSMACILLNYMKRFRLWFKVKGNGLSESPLFKGFDYKPCDSKSSESDKKLTIQNLKKVLPTTTQQTQWTQQVNIKSLSLKQTGVAGII